MTKEKPSVWNRRVIFALAKRKPSFATFFGIADSDRRVVNQKKLGSLKIGTERKTCP
jgi:hypothetical protein